MSGKGWGRPPPAAGAGPWLFGRPLLDEGEQSRAGAGCYVVLSRAVGAFHCSGGVFAFFCVVRPGADGAPGLPVALVLSPVGVPDCEAVIANGGQIFSLFGFVALPFNAALKDVVCFFSKLVKVALPDCHLE